MQKVGYAALQSAVAHRSRTNDRANAVNEYAQRVLDESARRDVSNQGVLAILRERVAELEKAADQSGECPVGYEENCGRAPNFRINDDEGNGRIARYIKRIPGSGQVAGTLGGYNDEAFLTDLVAEPRFRREDVVDPLPGWFIRLISSGSSGLDAVVGESLGLDDWGLTAEIERYHKLDSQAADYQQRVERLQTDLSHMRNLRQESRYRLARADAAARLASCEARSPQHSIAQKEGHFPGRHRRATFMSSGEDDA
jgi:hypothetical protein